ncbi:MAG: MFS transporter [Victivallaceae bacterium]|nr:MFS transporter [Victivallaceae bacterium]
MENQLSRPHFAAVASLNLISSFNPVFFCTVAALLIYRDMPIFERQALNVLLVAALYTTPFLLTGALAQYLNTRFSVRNVVLFTKAAEVVVALAGVICLMSPDSGIDAVVLLAASVGFGFIYSIYRPALKIYTAATTPAEKLPLICAVTESATFFGIVAGVVLAVVSVTVNPVNWLDGLLIAALAALSIEFAARLEPVKQFKRDLRAADLPRQWYRHLQEQPRYRELVLTGIGESYVFTSIIFISSMAIQYITLHCSNGANDSIYLYSIMGSPAIGAALGCLAGGGLSRRGVEIGLVPPVTLGMMASALLIGVLPLYSDVFIESGLLAILLFAYGFFAGVGLVPMQAYQKRFLKPELAPAFFSWFYMPLGIGILLTIAVSFLMYVGNATIFVASFSLALLTLLLASVTFFFMPQFLLRMLMMLLVRTLYRLRIFNAERIPENGGALLVANRASFVDMLFISACTPRPIRFMMLESYFNMPILHPLFKSVGFLEVPSNKPKSLMAMLEKTRQLLRQGELVCVFPEDDITRNGTMSSFRDDMSAVLPEEGNIPVIPVRIGMTWGSIFSCYYGKFKLRWPTEVPHPATVTVGNPVSPKTTAYEIRIILSELAAETELIPGPEEKPFHTQFASLAKKHPFRRNLWQFDGENWQKATNLSVLTRAVLMSRYVRRICGEDEEYVGIMLPNTINTVALFLGILMADRRPAVMNFTAGATANRHAVEIAGIRHVVTSRAFIERLHIEPTPEMVFLEDAAGFMCRPGVKWLWLVTTLLLPGVELIKLLSPVSWRDVNQVAVLVFSSGSTGVPKGIMLTHHNVNADVSAVSTMIAWKREDRVLGNLPLFHSFGLTVCMWLPLVTGAGVVMMPNALDGVAGCRAIREGRVTLMATTPGFLLIYMRRGQADDFKSLRLTITGAERLRDDVADRYRNMTHMAITEGYGCTELSPVVSINVAKSSNELGIEVGGRGSIGAPLPGVCAKIVDPSTFELMPENTDGLMIVKGAIVMRGYINQPEKTAEVIRDGWYITGDIANMDRNGFITITGRLSRFSKIAGEMVPHELVEREINNILQPEDRLVAVCGATDARRGEKLLVFYTDRGRLAPDSLILRLRERGIPNLWIPKAENFIFVETLPMLGSGKLDLAALSKLAESYGDK